MINHLKELQDLLNSDKVELDSNTYNYIVDSVKHINNCLDNVSYCIKSLIKTLSKLNPIGINDNATILKNNDDIFVFVNNNLVFSSCTYVENIKLKSTGFTVYYKDYSYVDKNKEEVYNKGYKLDCLYDYKNLITCFYSKDIRRC